MWDFLKIFNSNHNLPSYSLFSKCFSWFIYPGVHRGTGFYFYGFFLLFAPLLARDSLSRFPRPCLRLTEKHWKIAPVLQIQTSSMKLRVRGCLFLVFLHIKTDGKNKLSFYSHIHIQRRMIFLGVSQEWKLWKILPDNNPNWNEHSFSCLLPRDVN